jgi:hypothetical protein
MTSKKTQIGAGSLSLPTLCSVPVEGWTYLYNSPKWHYFRAGRSLCCRWLYLGKGDDLDKREVDSPDNCAACAKRRKAEIAKAQTTPVRRSETAPGETP